MRRGFSLLPCFAQGGRCEVIGEVCYVPACLFFLILAWMGIWLGHFVAGVVLAKLSRGAK